MRQKLLFYRKGICTPIAFILFLCLSQITYSQDETFDRLPWLENLIAENNCCENATVLEYDQGGYSFIYIKPDYTCSEFENARLYINSGQFYCQDTDNFNCTQAYGLNDSQAKIIWQCGHDPEPETPDFGDLPWLADIIDLNNCCENAIVQEYDMGGYSFVYIKPDKDCEQAEAGRLYVNSGQFYCTDTENFSCVEAFNLEIRPTSTVWKCPGYTEPEPPDFSNFPWLTDIVNVDNCCNNAIIKEYDMGGYSFIYIEPDKDCGQLEEGKLYINTGQFYCADSENYNCLEAFGLETKAYNTIWQCSDNEDEPEQTTPNFPEMPWLLDLIDPTDCCAASSIIEFNFGEYSFIYLVPEDGCNQNDYGKLYINTGQHYCTDSVNFNCLDAYQLSFSAGRRLWNCSGEGSRLVSTVDQIELQAFPNPSTGIFNLDLLVDTNQEQFVSVYNIAGKEMQNFVVPANNANVNMQLDLSNYSNGVYILKLNTYNSTFTQKLILNK